MKKEITIKEIHRYCDFCEKNENVDRLNPCKICRKDMCEKHSFNIRLYPCGPKGGLMKEHEGIICNECRSTHTADMLYKLLK